MAGSGAFSSMEQEHLGGSITAKTALRREMRAQGVGNAALAERLESTEGTVRRLIDPDQRSLIGRVEAGLRALGQRLLMAMQAVYLPLEQPRP